MAPNRYYSNTAQETTLSSGITAGATSATVGGVSGFPASFPFTLIIDPDTASEEAVAVTNVAGTTLTIVRGQDNTVAVSHDAGAKVIHGHTARDFAEPQNHLGSTAGVHGLAGDLVGTSDAQALSNKDLTAGTNTFPTTLVKTTTAQILTNKDMTSGTNSFPTTLVTLTGSQTLTNKTLTSPVVTGGTFDDPAVEIENLVAEGVITCTSSTRPTHREGRMIYETDTDRLYVSDGSAWSFQRERTICYGLFTKTNQSIPDNSVTKLTWADAGEDVGGITDDLNNRFTVPTGAGGIYEITFNGGFDSNGTGSRAMRITNNGVIIAGQAGPPGALTWRGSVKTTWRLAVGDDVEFEVYQNSGGSLNFLGEHANASVYGPILP